MKNQTYDHFDPIVPIELRKKLEELAIEIKSNFISYLNNGAIDTGDINEIYGSNQPGYIAYQDGGYAVDCFYIDDEQYSFTEEQTESLKSYIEELEENFAKDELGVEKFNYGSLTEEELENWYEYQNENINPVLLRFELWVDKNNVFCRTSVNYTDAPYYRSKNDDTISSFSISTEEILSISKDDFIKKVKTNFDNKFIESK